MKNKYTIIFLVSGNGGTIRFLHQFICYLHLQESINIIAVIANKHCSAVDFAASKNINQHIINYSNSYTTELPSTLAAYQPDLIISTFHQLIDKKTVAEFGHKIMNVHYALLPQFKGLYGNKSLQAALDAHCITTGSTIHWVNENYDDGPIISQNSFYINRTKTFDELMDLMFKAACLNLANAILSHLDINQSKTNTSSAQISETLIHFSAPLYFDVTLLNESFWKQVKDNI